jgi:NADPH:quinone reductase
VPIRSKGTAMKAVVIQSFGEPEGLAVVGLPAPIPAVAVTASSAERGDRLRKLGATHMPDRSGEGEQDAPSGYDVIIDVVAGAHMPSFFTRLKPNGRMVVVGIVAGPPPPDFGMTMMAGFQKSMSFATFSSDTVPLLQKSHAQLTWFP